jgi:teichuronic acid biosynthesis glycosyltransferase TuaC
VRISVVTPFPLQTEPFRGGSIYQHLLHMREWADIKVYVPHPSYPRRRWLQPRTFLYQRAGFAHSTPGVTPEFIEYPAVPVFTRPVNGSTLSRYLLKKFREYPPDLVLSYCIYPDACGAVLAARRLSIPVVIGCLGSDVRRISDPISKMMVRYALRNADYVLAVSKELISRAIALGASPRRSRAISNGCDGTIFYPADMADARCQLGVASNARLIAFTGRLVELKGVQELLPAFFRMAASDPNLELALIGDGPLLGAYSKQAADAGVLDRVHFLSNTAPERVALWLAAANVFCLPSHSEGCPNAVIEALACGRPVVATDVGGIPDLVDGRSGILVPPHNSEALEGALRVALSRNWDPEAIAATFRRTWRDMAAETFRVCEDVYLRSEHSRATAIAGPVRYAD